MCVLPDFIHRHSQNSFKTHLPIGFQCKRHIAKGDVSRKGGFPKCKTITS